MGIVTADFNIDKYINPYVPPNLIHRLPSPISRFLGYSKKPRRELGNVLIAFWALVGAFTGLVAVSGFFMIPSLKHHSSPPPIVIASFGAACILEYNTIESPIAQPRNSFFGHVISVVVGVGITKLFRLSSDFESLRWVAGALSCGIASALMTLTKTIYPPAGATALLAAVDPQVEALGWFLVPLVLLSSTVILFTSLVINNIQRRYPTYWWTPVDILPRRETDIEKVRSDSSSMLKRDPLHNEEPTPQFGVDVMIRITPDRIIVPENVFLAEEEKATLEVLRKRLGDGIGELTPPADAHVESHGL